VSGYAQLNAAYHGLDDDGKNTLSGEQIRQPVKAGQPMVVDITYYVGAGSAGRSRAEEVARGFAKSAGMRVSSASGVFNGKDYVSLHTVTGRVNFTSDKNTGVLNETGARRYKQMVKGFLKQGIEVEVNGERRQYANSYASREEFEAALARYMGEVGAAEVESL
jgi:hypothetical protein